MSEESAWIPAGVTVALEIEVREERDGDWHCWLARHPVTGIMSQGKTREDAIDSLRSAIEGTFIVMREHGQSYEDAQYRDQAFRHFIERSFRRGKKLVAALPDPRTFEARWRALNDTEPMAHEMSGETMRMYECLCACPIIPGGIVHGADCLLTMLIDI